MPRIRTVKPEIWNSRDFIALSETGQLAFFALIGHADDEGRLEADADHLHLIALRRSEPAAIEDQLTLMEGRGMIQRYEASGRPIIQLLNWSSHQKVDHPKASTLPAPPPSNPPTPPRRVAKRREPSRNVATASDATRGDANDSDESRGDDEASRAFAASRAPADRIGPDLTGPDRTGPGPAGAREELPEAVDPAVARRVEELRADCEGLLKRPLRADERPVVLGWAAMRRGEEPVPLPEILGLVGRLLVTPTRDSTLPGTLRYCDASVLALARGPGSNGRPAPAPRHQLDAETRAAYAAASRSVL